MTQHHYRKLVCFFALFFLLTACLAGCGHVKVADSSGDNAAAVPESMEDDTAVEPGMKMRKAMPGDKRIIGSTAKVSGLKAGFADDNKQYGYFIDFLKKYDHVWHRKIDVSERLVLSVNDANNKPVPNARVEIRAGKTLLTHGKTYADGTFIFFPSLYDKSLISYQVNVSTGQSVLKKTIHRDGLRQISFQFDAPRQMPAAIPLDIVFILDTTGSMGEEIARLKQTIELINMNLASVSPKPDIRFGMVLYKDRQDDYTTKRIAFTGDLSVFQKALSKVSAGGGGDTPEDLESALDDTLNRMQWRKTGIRLGFIITDAPLKKYQDQSFTYKEAVVSAKSKAIKLFSVGTGGLPLAGEYVLRQISQFTSAAYIFLSYGETGESEGGKPGSVSHHTGSNFQTDKLETVIIRFAKTELSYLSDTPIDDTDDYFQAVPNPDETKEATLKALFEKAATQLVDYSSYTIPPQTPVAVLPVVTPNGLAANGEYFTEQMVMAVGGNDHFKTVARQTDMQSVEAELKLGLSGMIDETNAAEIGRFTGASMLITGKLYADKGNYSLFLKLIRVETAEILSVTKLVIDTELGL